MDDPRISAGDVAPHYASQITDVRHCANAVVDENHPLADHPESMVYGRSLITLRSLDPGRSGMVTYGPSDLEVGTEVEIFEYQINGRKWLVDYCRLSR